MIRAGDLVFDIGALDGKYTEEYLQLGARVVAVEPQPGRAGALVERFKGREVKVVCNAVGKEAGAGKLYLTAVPWLATMDPGKWGRGRFGGYRWNNAIDVYVVTLDSLIEKYEKPAFIKIDVEGCEPEVIAGLSIPVQELCFEFTKEYLTDIEICADLLSKIGDYEYAISYGDSHRPGEYGPVELAMVMLRQQEALDLWGDIYARLRNG